jgi:hypothetical protein
MKRLLMSPILWAMLAAVVVSVPIIRSYDIIATDATHVVHLEGLKHYSGYGPLTLYRFADGSPEHMSALISAGFYPWFTNLDHKMNLFRPIPSLLIYLNHRISRLNPVGYPVHSLLWYLLLIVSMGVLARLITAKTDSGGFHPVCYIALLLFALAARNYFFIIYAGGRYLLILLTFGLAGLTAHIKWREQGWKPGRWLSLCAFLLCLLCGEAALALLAYLAAYELFGSPDALKKRINALLPVGALVVIYLLFYRLMDYGTANFDLYTNPFNDPMGFISALPVRLTAMLGELSVASMSLLKLLPDGFSGSSAWPYLLTGAGALVFVGLLFYPVWKAASLQLRRRFRWLMAGTLAAMVPLAPAQPNSRVVLVLSIGGSILLAFILFHWWQQIRRHPKSLAWIGAVACLALVGIHLVYAPYSWFKTGQGFEQFNGYWRTYHDESVLNEVKPSQTAIFLNGTGGDAFMSGYRHRLVNRLPVPGSWWPLSYLEKNNRYVRTAANKLELEILEGNLYDSPNVIFARYPGSPLKRGEVLTFTGLQVRILEVDERGPIRMEFTFDRSLDDPTYVFYKLHQGKLHIVSPPAPGEALTL